MGKQQISGSLFQSLLGCAPGPLLRGLSQRVREHKSSLPTLLSPREPQQCAQNPLPFLSLIPGAPARVLRSPLHSLVKNCTHQELAPPPTAHPQASRSLRWGPECVEEEGSLGAWANS